MGVLAWVDNPIVRELSLIVSELDGESLDVECLEDVVLNVLSDETLHLPVDSRQLLITVNKTLSSPGQHNQITNLLQKFAVQLLIRYT